MRYCVGMGSTLRVSAILSKVPLQRTQSLLDKTGYLWIHNYVTTCPVFNHGDDLYSLLLERGSEFISNSR